jgi:hypothetical protein
MLREPYRNMCLVSITNDLEVGYYELLPWS